MNGCKYLSPKAPKPQVPDIQKGTPELFKEAELVKVRYGPFVIPSTLEETPDSKRAGVPGVCNSMVIGAKTPCLGNCT
jgi:hypothetical protein